MEKELFVSALRSQGDRAGVFEYDGETGYFYLYDVHGNKGNRIIAAIPLLSGTIDFGERDVLIRWDGEENLVGLFVRKKLWAVFNLSTGATYGGMCQSGAENEIPRAVKTKFET